ncbi:hypothetical protein [Xanthomonas phage BUDD]|nr:hypothetical protein [Xanthomonas phage BUDD]
MSEETVSVLPLPEEPAYLQWLKKEGFELESTIPLESDSIVWVRKTKYGTPRCAVNGVVIIEVVKTGDLFSMGVRASTKTYWATSQIYGFDEEKLVKYGRQYETRVVDAWRELSL